MRSSSKRQSSKTRQTRDSTKSQVEEIGQHQEHADYDAANGNQPLRKESSVARSAQLSAKNQGSDKIVRDHR